MLQRDFIKSPFRFRLSSSCFIVAKEVCRTRIAVSKLRCGRRLCAWCWVHLVSLSVSSSRLPSLRISYLSLSASQCNVNESSSVHHSLVGTALWLLLLLLWFDLSIQSQPNCPLMAYVRRGIRHCWNVFEMPYLWCLRLDLTGTGKGSVNFTHVCVSVVSR